MAFKFYCLSPTNQPNDKWTHDWDELITLFICNNREVALSWKITLKYRGRNVESDPKRFYEETLKARKALGREGKGEGDIQIIACLPPWMYIPPRNPYLSLILTKTQGRKGEKVKACVALLRVGGRWMV